jgi:hypothetical protein
MESRISFLTFLPSGGTEEPTIVLIVSARGRAQMVVIKASLRRRIIVP